MTGEESSEHLLIEAQQHHHHHPVVRFRVTGSAAHSRLSPLLVPSDECCWKDVSPNATTTNNNRWSKELPPDFLWENAPRHETRSFRDNVLCYSHLPNGTDILDSKWVLARLLGCCDYHYYSATASCVDDSKSPLLLATLETHCFRGKSGFRSLCERLSLDKAEMRPKGNYSFRDLLGDEPATKSFTATHLQEDAPPNVWVIKDASSNGAGGIWVVGSENAAHFCNESTAGSSPLIEDHRYVAQRYAWPPVLYAGRKCHVRVYGLMTADGRAFVHKRAFLHVANDPFTTTDDDDDDGYYQDSVHITNCCANSHDASKFAGEICADLEELDNWNHLETTDEPVVPLGKFAPSIYASVAELAKRTFPFLQGGTRNNGFEYLGMDFILSYRGGEMLPIAYLLEVNAPPSQDTATGLSHAEDLHDSVIRDLLSLWVLPNVMGASEEPGGWQCVYKESREELSKDRELILPSKAAILNKIRWAIFERKAARHSFLESALEGKNDPSSQRSSSSNTRTPELRKSEELSHRTRSLFPFFNKSDDAEPKLTFFENAGGSQVPASVIDAVCSSLANRNRSVIGAESKAAARDTLHAILGASHEDYSIFLGPNASSLLNSLATQYVRSGLLKKSDEIIISSDNHLANTKPWLDAAAAVGATVKWWCLFPERTIDGTSSTSLKELLTTKTRIVAIPHASNILGRVRDIETVRETVNKLTNGYGHVVVDGVASVPHVFAAVDETSVDWFVVSCHKLFGPHLGVLCGRRSVVDSMFSHQDTNSPLHSFELGTVSFEACAGVQGLGQYFSQLSALSVGDDLVNVPIVDGEHTREQTTHEESFQVTSPKHRHSHVIPTTTRDQVKDAYCLIATIEVPLTRLILDGLTKSPKVRIIEDENGRRLPVISFVHCDLSSYAIVTACAKGGVAARNGTFLSCVHLQQEYNVDPKDGVVRFSLAHYNTQSEVHRLIKLLESIPGWF